MSGWDREIDWTDVIAECRGGQPANPTKVDENLDDWTDWGESTKSTTVTRSQNSHVNESQNRGWNESRNRNDRNGWNDRYKWNESCRDHSGYRGSSSNQGSNQSNHWKSQDRLPVRQSEYQRESSLSNATIIQVPSSDVGKIIGRGGSKIKELQEKSGARIKVLRNDINNFDTGVQIIGDDSQRKIAEDLIKELTEGSSNQFSKPSPSSEVHTAQEEVVQIDWGALIRDSVEATKQRWAKAPPIEKNFYVEDPMVAAMHPDDVKQYRLSHNNIMVTHYNQDDERPIPNPTVTFKQAFAEYPAILEAVQRQNFSEPSPVQTQAWPILLRGHDLIGIAQTGTGKTLAFLLPALVHIEGQSIPRSERDGPTVLIMAPTRELAQQIEREVGKFPYKGIRCVCVYGGGDRRKQMNTVAKGVEIVVATPGRLYDLMQAGVLKTSSVSYVVLDEADRMLDLGFEPQIKKILIEIRPDKQIVMTSATWPEGIRRIANDYMNKPLQVCIGTLDLAAVHSVTQHVEILTEDDKRSALLNFIASMESEDKAIIFVGRKLIADQISSDLSLKGIVCQCIHGDRDQIDREQALADLRSGEARILIATDVASRGIDIKDITHILNYDFPRHPEEYVHRVGRTGRAGRTGIAISFFTREDWSKAADLINILEEAAQEVPPELHKMAERFAAWKQRKDEERKRNAFDMGGERSGGFSGYSGGFSGRSDGFGGGRGGKRGGFSRRF